MRILPFLLAAACMLGLVSWIGFRLTGHPAERLNRPRPAASSGGMAAAAEPLVSGGVAILTHAVDVIWEPGASRPAVGTLLGSGPLRFERGMLQLEFYSGATLIVEGPADLDLKGSDRALCRRGKLRAHVPPQARGFRIESPAADLVDLGTEFVMEVGQDRGAEVYVIDGSVQIHDPGARAGGPGGRAPRELTEGQGLSIAPAGAMTVRPPGSEPRTFPSFLDIERLDAEEIARRLTHWRGDLAAWRSDSRLVAHYAFERDTVARSRSRTLVNLAPPSRSGVAVSDGAIVGCDWVEGRWPGKGALEFKRPGDRVRVEIPGRYRALTLMAWVRVDALPHRLSSLLLTDGFYPRQPHWQINQDGDISLSVHQEVGRHWTNYRSPHVFSPDRLGRWTHVAVVYDSSAGTITHYVDGRLDTRHDLAEVDRLELEIGAAEIGNWGAPISGDLTPVRNLYGRIDEFFIFDAALEPGDLTEAYARGRPGS